MLMMETIVNLTPMIMAMVSIYAFFRWVVHDMNRERPIENRLR
jgi:hypothetical protein